MSNQTVPCVKEMADISLHMQEFPSGALYFSCHYDKLVAVISIQDFKLVDICYWYNAQNVESVLNVLKKEHNKYTAVVLLEKYSDLKMEHLDFVFHFLEGLEPSKALTFKTCANCKQMFLAMYIPCMEDEDSLGYYVDRRNIEMILCCCRCSSTANQKDR